MGDISELAVSVDDFNNTLDLLPLNELIDALSDHTEALERHSAILEKMHEDEKKQRTLSNMRTGLPPRSRSW